MPGKKYRLVFEHEECYIDEVNIVFLYRSQDDKKEYLLEEYADEWDYKGIKDYYISKELAAKWIVNKYTNEESTSEEIKEEKIYILHLMGISTTKIGEYFGVSRQTAHKKIKKFEDERLQQFLHPIV